MSRSFSSVSKWVLCIVLIALLIASFACCLLFSPGASVASALSVDISDDGIVSNNNLLPFSWYSDISTGNGWEFNSIYSWDLDSSSDYGSFSQKGKVTPILCLYYSMQLQPGTYTFSISSCPDSSSAFDRGGSYDYRLAYKINDNEAIFDFLVNYTRSSIGIFEVSSITFTVDSVSEVSVGLYNHNSNGATDYIIDIKFFKLEEGSSFTGYVNSDISTDDIYNEGYEAGYNQGQTEGHDQGYKEGYEQGTADGVISSNDIFLCTAFDIQYDSDKKNIYINKGDKYNSYTNFVVNTITMEFVPFSCLVYSGYDGYFYPKDVAPTSTDDNPDIGTSSYWITFDSLTECGQWLLDNPNDFLCSYVVTGELEPAVLVFSDLTRLPNFMSGAGESYEAGFNDGYNNGQKDGNKTGYSHGYNAGYNEGVVSGADYSFLGLIGAVVDAPIKSFQGLLDFEILGVNMSSFVMAMFSLCFIFLLLKLVLR